MNLNIVGIKNKVTSSKQIFAIYPLLNWKFSILKYLDDVQSPEYYVYKVHSQQA